MNQYVVSPLAREHLRSIWEYIGVVKDSPAAAHAQLKRIYDKFTLLARQPLLGQLREDLRPDLRMFVADRYVILYYPTSRGIEVAAVVHSAQDIESVLRRGDR